MIEWLMLFRQLEYFVALARSVTSPAPRAPVTCPSPRCRKPSASSNHELNVPLVRRGQKFEGLTPEGERLVQWARRILADRDALKQEVTALQTGLIGELRLGVVPAASTTVALLTDPFCAAHPLVRVQLEVNLRSAGIVERIRKFELDAGILYPDQQDTADLLVTPLYHEQPVLIAGRRTVSAVKRKPSRGPNAAAVTAVSADAGHAGPPAHRRRAGHPRPRGHPAAGNRFGGRAVRSRSHRPVGEHRAATWIHTLGVPAGVSVLRLRRPSVTALIALVTNRAEPGSLLARALRRTAREARIGATLSELP